ncbi:unnamed protein product [Nezara viridula]|uniref:Phosphatidylinositol-specific phospholipase C X domain-containing protein n=1 Tax=Nezara viridula TaxID=85310 RepID=A0A9P0E0L9_NEZVI|nr:unnamed protein product [Nezara viridula]
MGVTIDPFHLLLVILFSSVIARNDFYIEIVVSPIVRSDIIGEIRLIWESRQFVLGDRVVLYRSGDVVFQYEPQGCSGSIDTGSFVGETNFTQSYTTYCTIFSGAYVQDNETMAYSCLQNSPTWMNDIRNDIENLSLGDIFIPGTHDSASYVISKTAYLENILQKYVYTQDVSVLEQLMMGVRYLDLRIGFYNHTLGEPPFNWWCNHDFMPVQPLSGVFKQIKQFVINTNEIVIVDFHHFPIGFNDIEIHHRLVKYIQKELGELLHKRTDKEFGVSLKSIWNSGRRLILSYNKDIIADAYKLYLPIKQQWGNKQTFSELYPFLNEQFERCERDKKQMWAAMAELTPSTLGVLTDWYGGLRNLANRINTNLTLSFRSCRKWATCSNIVAVDFFRSTGLVNAAIKLNRERAKAWNGTTAVHG